MSDVESEMPESGKGSKAALQAAGGVVPFVGGVFSAIAVAWSEKEQDKVNKFFRHWAQMLEDELKEKEETIVEIMARLDLQDQAISERVDSRSYQSLVKKTFREWSCAESEEKRELSEIFWLMLQVVQFQAMTSSVCLLIGSINTQKCTSKL
ncbi:hypothetical protein ACFOEE_09675 [Pseudoalteromonas fenneropenaei]|uniref:Uncharacterized protein n=1 Tax=Pseudoalteromonas fenneropenaei TaxID=1737459 RepID=A0ABV7CJV3_9GAMM